MQLSDDEQPEIMDDAAQDARGEAVEQTDQESPSVPLPEDTGGTEAAASDTGVADGADDSAWRQPYEQLGFRQVETPEEAQQRLIQAYQQRMEQLREAQEQIAYMRSLHARLDSVSPQQQAPAQAQSEADADLFEQASSNWVEVNTEVIARYVTEDEDGNPAWKPGTPPEIQQQVAKYKEAQYQWQQVVNNPKRLAEAIDKRVERLMTNRLSEQLTQRDSQIAEQQAEQQFVNQNQWIWERDPVTGDVARDFTGNAILSRDGQFFMSLFEDAGNRGLSRFQDRAEWAMDKMRLQAIQRQQAPANERAAASPAAQQRRQEMLGRSAANRPNSGQTTASGLSDSSASRTAGTSRMSASARALMALKEEGYQL